MQRAQANAFRIARLACTANTLVLGGCGHSLRDPGVIRARNGDAALYLRRVSRL